MRLSLAPAVALAVLLGAACSAGPAATKQPTEFRPPPAGPSWAPAPVEAQGLRTLAEARGDQLALRTAHGDVSFWTGVNLGSTTPGHSPGELAMTAQDYRRWFDLMGRMGIRVVRVYTILPPQMYAELLRYNAAHPQAPLYLVQGVYFPDESYLETGDLYDAGPTRAMAEEVRAASDAVHGDLVRTGLRGRANGTWTADVSAWVAAWIVGVELDPRAASASDARNAARPDHRGRYFGSRSDGTSSTPTERWLAARMDELATAEAARGTSAPIAFVNWPTTDPLRHPAEPLPQEDLLQLDANHVRPTTAWPAGTFASYHAYPYYPDFLRHQPEYQGYEAAGRTDPYGGYLADLRRHHAGMPVVVSEFGVPSSIGSAHVGTLGRDQGGHGEQEAMATDAALLRVIRETGLSGGFVFSWTDEWFKRTWNTEPRQAAAHAERRALWHDPLTNEQWFGLLATDPVRTGWRTVHEARTGVRQVRVDTDAAFVHLELRLEPMPQRPWRIGFDVLPGGGDDVAVVVDPARRTAQARIRGALDPVLLDGLPAAALPPVDADGWTDQRLTLNRPLTVLGRDLPAEFQEVGRLREGDWDAASARYDSRSMWRLDGDVLHLRMPWSLLAVADPSSHTAVVPVPGDGRPTAVPIGEIGLTVSTGGEPQPVGAVRWADWQQTQYTERVKRGIQPLLDALHELAR